MKNVGIIALGRCLPKPRLTNYDLEKMVETSDEWITVRTGIKERRFVEKGAGTSSLAIGAAQDAIKRAGISPHKVELIIVATATPDHGFPSTACLVQRAIGAKHAAVFDLSAACAGFPYALTTAKQFVKTGMYKNALVIAAETMSSVIDWTDRNTCVLFGDGAGACLLAPVRGKGIISDYLEGLGEFADLMSIVTEDKRHPCDPKMTMGKMPYVVMRGREIFKVAVNSMAHVVRMALKQADVKISQVKCVVPHQANDRIISAVANKLGIPKDKFFINIHRYGNMSAASTAVALYEAVEFGRIKKGDYVVLVAFGAGLVSAANVVKW